MYICFILLHQIALKIAHKNKIALSNSYFDYNYIREQCAIDMIDRLSDIKYKFPLLCDIGCGGGEIKKAIAGKQGVTTIFECDKASIINKNIKL